MLCIPIKTILKSISRYMSWWNDKRYHPFHPENPLPEIQPHILRHTFCTRKAEARMNPKVLQYLMGHSSIDMILNLYAHTNQGFAEEELRRIEGL